MIEQKKHELVPNVISFYSVFSKEVLDLVTVNNNSQLSPLLYRALHTIYLEKTMLPSDLSKRLTIPPTNTSRIIKKLIELSYIRKTKDKKDNRVMHLSLTENGTKLIELSLKTIEEALLEKLKVLTSEELGKLSDAFAVSRDLLMKAEIQNNHNDSKKNDK